MNSLYSKMVTSAVILIGIVSGGFVLDLSAVAAEPASSPLQFERIDFPAGRVGNWQKEVQQLVEVPRDEFLSLLERLTARQRGPRSAWLKSAHYEATLVNDGLRGGIMTASVQRLGTQAALLELGPTSLALEELKWQDRPAVWGSSGDGRAWLLTDGRHDELLGEWTCRGRAFPGGIDFDLQLPSATTSFLDLRVPSGYLVQARQAEVTLLTESETETIRLWRLHIGSDNRCRFTCVARQGLEIRPPSLIVEHDLETAIREEDLKFKLLLHLEVFEAPIREVTLRVPAGLVIDSALYGSDTNVSFDRSSEVDQVGRLTIQLPGPLLGRGRVLRLEGVMSQKPGQPTSIPQIVVENSTFAGGRHTLLVQSPLQVRSIRTNGFRQQTPLTLSPDGETVRFQQITAEAQLVVDVHRPQVSLAGQVQCLLDTGDDSWTLTSDISFSALIGSGFQASCQFPRDWEVTDVQPIQSLESDRLATPADERSQTRQTPKLLWDVKPQGGGNSLLQIEFLKAIQPGQTQAVRVTARRQNWRATEIGMAVPIPIPQLLNCETTDVIFGIQTPNAVTPQFSDDARLERIAKPNSRDLSDSPEKPGSERRWFHSDSPDGNGTLQLLSRLQPIIAQTETAIDASVSEYRVRYSVRFEPRENQADRILVYLTEPTPDVRWSWKGTQTVELIATKLAKSQYIEWNLASNGDPVGNSPRRLTGRS